MAWFDEPMAHWIAVVPEERFFAERLFHHDTVEIPTETAERPEPGDDVVLVADGATPLVFGLGQVSGPAATVRGGAYDADDPDAPGGPPVEVPLTVAYTHRLLDDPIPAGDLGLRDAPAATTTLSHEHFAELAGQVRPQHAVDAPRREWLVSVDLPIEATSPSEAVRQFWSYVMSLGPQELPAFVAPADDELAMQAYVLGEETELDPEDSDSP